MKVKVMEYNILNGFHSQEEPYTHHPHRQELAQKLVREQDPDILVLTEATFAFVTRHDIQQDYQKIFNFPHCFVGRHSEKAGIAILSKAPFTAQDYGMYQRGFARAQFHTLNNLVLDAVHTHPKLPTYEKAKFIRGVIRDKKCPYILTGDFNSISPEDTYDKEVLLRGFNRFEGPLAQKVVEGLLKAEMVQEVLIAGLVDSFLVHNNTWSHTVPTDLLSKEKDSAVRIDYIFCSKDIKVLESKIIKDEVTEQASDHYPIYSILEI